MKYTFQLLSDIHLEMGTYHNIKPKAPYLLLVGDIGYPETRIYQDFMKQCSKKFEKVFYVSGNHEYYQSKHKCKSIDEIDAIIEDICKHYDIHYLQNSSYDFEDLKIVGSTLWSDVLITDELTNDYLSIYKTKNKHIKVADTLEMYRMNKEYLTTTIETSDKPLLIMTHHLPSYKMILPVYETSLCKSHFASHLDNLFKKPLVAWVCGHSHGFNKQIINNIPCIMNSIGYPSEQRKGASTSFVLELDI